jgi:perosamine synthetase
LHLRNDRHSVFNSKPGRTPNLDVFYENFVHIPCGWWVMHEDREKIVNLIMQGW